MAMKDEAMPAGSGISFVSVERGGPPAEGLRPVENSREVPSTGRTGADGEGKAYVRLVRIATNGALFMLFLGCLAPLCQILKLPTLAYVFNGYSIILIWMQFVALIIRIDRDQLGFWRRRYEGSCLRWLVMIPVLRQIFFLLRPVAPKWEVRLMALCALGAWGGWIFVGPAHMPALVWMVISTVFALHLQGTGLRVALPGKLKARIWFLAIAAFLLIGGGMGCREVWQRDIARKLETLRAYGMPRGPEEVPACYYQGIAPDEAYTGLVAETSGFAALRIREEEYLRDAEKRRALMECLESAEFRKCAEWLDRRMEEGAILKYRLQPKSPIYTWELPQLTFCRGMACGYRWRIVRAAERGDRAGAMRLLRLLNRFQETLLREGFLVGHLVALAGEEQRQAAIAGLLGAGGLTDTDLMEMEEMEFRREAGFRDSAVRGMAMAAAMEYQLFRQLLWSPLDVEQKEKSSPALKTMRGGMSPDMWEHVFALGSTLQNLGWERRLLDYQIRRQELFAEAADARFRPERVRPLRRTEEAFRKTLWGRSLLPEAERILRREAECVARARMCRAALALERSRRASGEWRVPAEPVDPLTGKPFVLTVGENPVGRASPVSGAAECLTGWRLEAPDRNPGDDPEKRENAERVSFTVITQRAPALPEAADGDGGVRRK